MTKTKKLTTMAMLMAVALALVAIIRIPIIPTVPFMLYDPADIPILIGTFVFGPLAGIVMTLIVSVIQAFAITADGIYGAIMHFVATGTFVLVAGCIYQSQKTRKRAMLGLIVATVITVAVMAGANLIITPLFTGWPVKAVRDLLITGIIPFNLIKFVLNGFITFLVYKPISNIVKKTGKADKKLSGHDYPEELK